MEYFQDDTVVGKAYDRRIMGRLYPYARPYAHSFFISLAASAVIAGLTNLGPYITARAIDLAILPKELGMLPWYAGIYLLVVVGEFLARYIQVYAIQYLGQHVMYDLRTALFRHIQGLNLRFFDRNPVGRLVTRLTSDVNALDEMFTAGVITIIGDVLILVAIAGMMLWLNWRLALATLALMPVLLWVSNYFRGHIRACFRLVKQTTAAISSYMQENIVGMGVVQLFNRQKRNAAKFDELNQDYNRANIDTIFYFALFFPAIEVISSITVALILWYGGIQILKTALTLGELVAFIQYVQKFYRPIMDLSEKYNILQGAMASAERIFQILDTHETIEDPAQPAPITALRGDISYRNVWFSYGSTGVPAGSVGAPTGGDAGATGDWVLKDISFEVKQGQKVALVGATGAGKSSIINCLSRFYDVQQGSILVDGRNLREYNKYELRQHIATVLQDVFIFAGDVSFNIGLGNPRISQETIEKAAFLVHADTFIRKLPQGYKTNLKERGAILSTGQKQLLAFARALAHDPGILILDEATSSIDTETEALIQDALKTLMKDRTSLIIAHRLSTIVSCEKILVLHHGKVREEGTHEELLAQKGIYHRLYMLQYQQVAAAGAGEKVAEVVRTGER